MLNDFLDKWTKPTITIIECAFIYMNFFGHDILIYLFFDKKDALTIMNHVHIMHCKIHLSTKWTKS